MLNRESGQLIFAVVIVLFVFLLGMVIIQLMPSEYTIAKRTAESNQAFYLAQSGLQQAVYFVNNNPDLASLNLSLVKSGQGNILVYTLTYTYGSTEKKSLNLNSVSLGEYTVNVSYSLLNMSSGGIIINFPVYKIVSTGYIPSISNSRIKRTIEVYGNNTDISLDPFKFAVYAGKSVSFAGKSAVIEGERLPDGSFDTAIYSNGPVDLRNPPLINGTYSPILGKDVIANDNTLTMPVLNDAYLKSISQSQGLYRSGSNIDLKAIVAYAKSNPNWYNSATNTWLTWSLVIYIEGSAKMAGNVEFQGMIVVKGDVKITGTGNKVKGILYAASVDTTVQDLSIYGDPIIEGTSIGEDVSIGGNSTVRHNKQYIENIFSTHGITNVVKTTKTKLKVLAWQEK
ncbi:MAG: FapA family protein [Dictyoglomus thermophilum]|uniref:hypothetical protein n=1 Tax=Dictyoglomus thermophilum TaxID=14 RepID=UPI0011EB7814|nr:hypothetical protein [Dictyoglomus thermophilum]MCX7721427.1 FapA family protein [Dictyoglomus thermophilum]TYT20966.1 hypothetical protein FY122_08870 [Dictyoglomus thermophilum]